MKKIIFFSCSLIILLNACSSNNKNVEETDSIAKADSIPQQYQHLIGFWVGNFYSEDHLTPQDQESTTLNIAIKNISMDNQIEGLAIIGGFRKMITGKIVELNNKTLITIIQEGNDKYDGTYHCEFKKDSINGNWIANNKSSRFTKSSFTLIKKEFAYNAKLMLEDFGEPYADFTNAKYETSIDSIEPGQVDTIQTEYNRMANKIVLQVNSSTHLFKEKELKNLKKLELEILRNTIYARHGYTFKSKTDRQFFDMQDWYVPLYNNIDDQLTDIEKANIRLFTRFEKYAKDNYESFGR